MLEYSYVSECFGVDVWSFEVWIFQSKVLFSDKCKGNILESDILLYILGPCHIFLHPEFIGVVVSMC